MTYKRGFMEFNEQGKLLRVNGSSVDTIDRDQALDAVTAIALLPAQDPSPVLVVNADGLLLYMNAASGRLLGKLHLQLGQPVFPSLREGVQQSLRTGQSVQVEHESDYRHYFISITPIVSDNCANLYWTDITERKRAEDALRESEATFRVMADTAPILIWISDTTKLCTWFNQPWLDFTGRAMEQELGNGWAELVHPDDVDRCWSTYTASFDRRQPFTMEYRSRRRDGQYRWLMDHGIPRHAENGEFLGYIGSCIDVTDRKESEIQTEGFAEELERQLTHRTKELHQLATELNVAEQRERRRLAEELHDHLQQTLIIGKLKLSQGKRLADGMPACANIILETDQLLSEALTYTRTLVAELSPLVLREHGLAAALKWIAEHMKKKYDLTVGVALPETEVNPLPENQAVLLFQCVRELLINSAKYSRKDEAWITVNTVAESIEIVVKDQGIGFDCTALNGSAVPDGSSSKFGLFSIRERMKALGGSFSIESSVGKGTIAVLRMPLSVAEAGSTRLGERDQETTVSRQTRQPISVLLVDDHAMVRQGLRAVFEGYKDFTVIGEASNGEEAIEAVAKLRPQIVLMDVNMPRKNGIETTAAIKAHYPWIIVIGVSVNPDPDKESAMLKAGAATLIHKESAVECLYETMKEVVKNDKGVS